MILSKPKVDGTTNDYVIDGVKVRAFTDHKQPNRIIPSADLVISHLGGAQRSSIIARQSGIPVIQVIHNDLPYTMAMARHAQFLVYNTAWVMDSFCNSRHVRPPGIVVRPPVDPSKYRVESTREYITLVNLADGEGGPYDKGPEMFYYLAQKFPEQKFLGVVGAYGNQDIRDVANVTIVPNTEDIREVYSKTKIVLSPSNYESYGRISVEGACSGIPSITSEAPGFLEHSIGFARVPYRDYSGWETALHLLLDSDTYGFASRAAEEAASQIWEKSQMELRSFVATCEHVAKTMRKPPRR